PGKRGKAGVPRPRFHRPLSSALCLLSFVLCFSAMGCPGNNRVQQDDPLIGGGAPTPPAPPTPAAPATAVPPASASAVPPAATGGVPPLPPVTQTTAIASLPANTPLPDSRPLGIDDPSVKKSTWNGPAPAPETNGTGTTLNPIQPITPA